MGQTKICQKCKKPIPVEEKNGKYYFYEHYDYDKGKQCPNSEKEAK